MTELKEYISDIVMAKFVSYIRSICGGYCTGTAAYVHHNQLHFTQTQLLHAGSGLDLEYAMVLDDLVVEVPENALVVVDEPDEASGDVTEVILADG